MSPTCLYRSCSSGQQRLRHKDPSGGCLCLGAGQLLRPQLRTALKTQEPSAVLWHCGPGPPHRSWVTSTLPPGHQRGAGMRSTHRVPLPRWQSTEPELEQTPDARRDGLLSPAPSLLGPQAAPLWLSMNSRAKAPGRARELASLSKMTSEDTRSFNSWAGKEWALEPRNGSKNGFDPNDGKQRKHAP